VKAPADRQGLFYFPSR